MKRRIIYRDLPNCRNCGTRCPLSYHAKQTHFCDLACRYEYRQKTHYWRVPKPKDIPCVVCHVMFSRKHSRKITCSPRCFNYRNHHRQRFGDKKYKGRIRIDMTLKEFRKWRKDNA